MTDSCCSAFSPSSEVRGLSTDARGGQCFRVGQEVGLRGVSVEELRLPKLAPWSPHERRAVQSGRALGFRVRLDDRDPEPGGSGSSRVGSTQVLLEFVGVKKIEGL